MARCGVEAEVEVGGGGELGGGGEEAHFNLAVHSCRRVALFMFSTNQF
jgi:hypothetical protein